MRVRLSSGLLLVQDLRTLEFSSHRLARETQKSLPNGLVYRRLIAWKTFGGIPRSARYKLPVIFGKRPVLGSARAMVQRGRMYSPGVSPVVALTPEGTSSERIGASDSFAQRIKAAAFPQGAESKLFPTSASMIRSYDFPERPEASISFACVELRIFLW